MKAWGVFLVAAVLLILPSGATAKPGYFVTGPHRNAMVRLHGSDGYAIEIEASSAKSDFLPRVTVTATKGAASITYMARGSLATDGSISAHLPHVGRIAVEFEPVRTTRKRVAMPCDGRASVDEYGYFRGTMELHGERGFTAVDRSSARGHIVRSFRQVCDYGAPSAEHAGKQPPHQEPAFSFLMSGTKANSVSFMALEARFGSKSLSSFIATSNRFREGMLILGRVSAEGEPGDFVSPPRGRPRVAEVTPPAPFEGAATFKLISPKTSTWEGDLAVEMPGQGRVKLAGPDFYSGLCDDGHCTDTTPENIAGVVAQFIS